MSLKSITQLNVDFCNKKYISINAKQNDKESRFLEITCYDQGKLFPINNAEHFAYVRYKKADDYGVFNECEIKNGKILVELTEQMLAAEGICYADLVIVNRGSAEIDYNTGEVIFINNTGILSTMTFCISVFESAIENSEFESTYEFDKLNRLLDRADADYQEVILTSKSWAIGNTGIRDGEDTDNAKYYASKSKDYMNNAETFKNNANTSATKAAESAAAALSSEQKASTSEKNALSSENLAKSWAVGGTGKRTGEDTDNAKYYSNNANTYMSNAKTYMDNANTYKNNANDSAVSAASSAEAAHLDANRAEEYKNVLSGVIEELNGAFLPMGTVTYEELAELKNDDTIKVGFVYNISNDFVTDDNFKDGAGVEYTAGTNVYCTADGYLDCLSGHAVTGIKGNAETSYRKGSVNITPENIGAVALVDIATADEVKNYLGIM